MDDLIIRECSVDGCSKPRKSKDSACSMHVARKSRTGTYAPPPHSPERATERFHGNVDKGGDGGCWVWTGTLNNKGYGRAGRRYAHRIAWEMANGPIPPGLFVLHTCDNPPCVNPDHLGVGTAKDNSSDASRKGRLNGRPNRPKGEQNKSHVLTEDQVRFIRDARAAGESRRFLAEMFGVSRNEISRVTTRRLWKHLP